MLASTPDLVSSRFEGKLYRALNPVYAREPLSGLGAQLYGGRFNAKGRPALYTSLSIVTAIKEANQAGTLQPTTLVSYEAEIESVFDARSPDALASCEIDARTLADPGWRDQMIKEGMAPTQKFAEKLITQEFQGLLVPSFVHGATDEDFNLVLWEWGTSRVKLGFVDDEGRLGSLI